MSYSDELPMASGIVNARAPVFFDVSYLWFVAQEGQLIFDPDQSQCFFFVQMNVANID